MYQVLKSLATRYCMYQLPCTHTLLHPWKGVPGTWDTKPPVSRQLTVAIVSGGGAKAYPGLITCQESRGTKGVDGAGRGVCGG